MSVREIIKMIVVLTVVASVCGGGLALVKQATSEQIEYQKIKNIKEPALMAILSDYDNNPVKDRKKIVIGTDKRGKPIETTIFYAKKGSKVIAIALEAYGGGFEGPIGVMISIKQPDDVLGAIAVTTQSETPGVGTRVITELEFCAQFEGQSIDTNFATSSEGGVVDVLSGATYSSIGVSKAVVEGMKIYKKYKADILG